MSSYLHLKAGPYDLLLDVERVREVITLDDRVGRDAGGHRAWRGETLPVLDLPAVLGGAAGARPGSVVLDDRRGGHVYLDVDAIGRVLRLEDQAFQPLPPLPDAVEAAIDGVALVDQGGKGLLRLKLDALLAGCDT